TGSATGSGQLILWDPAARRHPVGRVALPNGSGRPSGTITGLAIDPYGDQVLAATSAALLTANLAKPSLMPVHVGAEQTAAEANLGVRLTGDPAPLPDLVEIALSVAEDDLLALDLSAYPALAILGSAPLIWQSGDRPQLGSLNVSQSGQIGYKPRANANGKDSASLKVYNGVATTTVMVSLNVTPVNDPPDAFTVDTVALPEASPAGAGAGFATVFDVDTDARYVISTSDPRFYVADGQLLLSGLGQLDYETEPVVQLTVTATDADNPQFVLSKQVAIPVLDSNDGPASITVSASAVEENVSGATVGHLQIADPDGHGSYVFDVSDDRFEVADGQLRLKDGQQLNYESEQRVTMTVTVHDPSAELNAAPVATTVIIDVLDRNDAPSGLFVEVVDVKEHEAGAFAGSVDVQDEDALDQYSFEVSDARFVVEGNSLRLKDGQELDRSDGPVLPVAVRATDGGGKAVSTTVSINVINDTPFQNPSNPFDVDNDGQVYPRDVLILINIINQTGPHVIEPFSSTGEGDNPMQGLYVDVNGDGSLTALDVLVLINQLNHSTSAAISDNPNDSPSEPTSPVGGVSSGGSEPLDCQSDMVYDSSLDACVEMDHSPPPEGEGYGFPFDERAEIDSELEILLEELSRERLR
ncbi:MAG: dockerin type I domain-containing protein, partial [Aureliella sp.]